MASIPGYSGVSKAEGCTVLLVPKLSIKASGDDG